MISFRGLLLGESKRRNRNPLAVTGQQPGNLSEALALKVEGVGVAVQLGQRKRAPLGGAGGQGWSRQHGVHETPSPTVCL